MSGLRVFLDANELIRLALGFHGDARPAQLALERLEVSGDPIAVIMLVAASGESVNGQHLVICSSVRTLSLAKAKLAEVYRWEPELLDEFIRLVVQLVLKSQGTVLRGAASPRLYGLLQDREDCHRLAEAHTCDAELFVTEDQEILGAWASDPTLRPIAISARSFVDRMRSGRS